MGEGWHLNRRHVMLGVLLLVLSMIAIEPRLIFSLFSLLGLSSKQTQNPGLTSVSARGALMPSFGPPTLFESSEYIAKKLDLMSQIVPCNNDQRGLGIIGLDDTRAVIVEVFPRQQKPPKDCERQLERMKQRADQEVVKVGNNLLSILYSDKSLYKPYAKCPEFRAVNSEVAESFSDAIEASLFAVEALKKGIGNCGEMVNVAMHRLSHLPLNQYAMQIFIGKDQHNFLVLTNVSFKKEQSVSWSDLPSDTIIVDVWNQLLAVTKSQMEGSVRAFKEARSLVDMLSLSGEHIQGIQRLYRTSPMRVSRISKYAEMSADCRKLVTGAVKTAVAFFNKGVSSETPAKAHEL